MTVWTNRRWRRSHGLTEALDNLVERVVLGMFNFTRHRIRALHYAGQPTWTQSRPSPHP